MPATIDLKGFTEAFYRNVGGGKLGDVLETLQYVKHETSCWLELTTARQPVDPVDDGPEPSWPDLWACPLEEQGP